MVKTWFLSHMKYARVNRTTKPPSPPWRFIHATHHTIWGSWVLRSTETIWGARSRILSKSNEMRVAPYPRFFNFALFSLIYCPFILANTPSHQLNMVPQKHSIVVFICDLVATWGVVLLHNLVTMNSMNLSSNRKIFLISIRPSF